MLVQKIVARKPENVRDDFVVQPSKLETEVPENLPWFLLFTLRISAQWIFQSGFDLMSRQLEKFCCFH
jgi:hypothetical protein